MRAETGTGGRKEAGSEEAHRPLSPDRHGDSCREKEGQADHLGMEVEAQLYYSDTIILRRLELWAAARVAGRILKEEELNRSLNMR